MTRAPLDPLTALDPMVLSQTGRWALPNVVSKFTVDSREGWGSSAMLGRRLGIQDDEVLKRIWAAVGRAVRDGEHGSVLLQLSARAPARLLLIRPAREPGLAVLTVQQVDAEPPAPSATLLADLFGFTATESAVALALLRGADTTEIAESRGGSNETVRGHVKSLLRKSGLSSQKQLMALLARIGMITGQPERRVAQ